MPIKCYRKPNRSKPRLFSPCDAARIASYAAKQHDDEEIILTVAKRLGYQAIAVPNEEIDSEFEEMIAEYETKADYWITEIQLWVGNVVEFLEAIGGLIDAVLGWVPDFLLDDSKKAESALAKILKGAARKLLGWVILVVELLKKVRSWLQDLESKFAELATFMHEIRLFFNFARQLRKLSVKNLNDYPTSCKNLN